MMKSLFRRSGNYNPHKDRRRPAITLQHFNYDEDVVKTITKHPKSLQDEMLIKSAVENNDFLSSLIQTTRLQDVVDCMYPEEVAVDQVIIEQGQKGTHLYISVKGHFDVIQNEELVSTFSDVRVFGELALLYNAPRLATIKARSSGKIWILDGVIFKHLIIRSTLEEQREITLFLETVPKLNTIGPDGLAEVAGLLKMEFFPTGTEIIKEGDTNPEKFYIIRAGSVTISKSNEGNIDKLYRGNFFGELALLRETVRAATVTADSPGTECLTLSRKEFIAHFGDIPDCFSINIQSQPYKPMAEIIEHQDLHLKDFLLLTTLGIGGFGRVDLVQHSSRKELVFALKTIKKRDLPGKKHREHVAIEKTIQMQCQSPFLVRLYRSYKDQKALYLLLEPCLGGDLWNLLHKGPRKYLGEDEARFYAACVLEGLHYLHERNIVFRDIKPENLLIDARGYVKLGDFGFAKVLDRSKTYTFAGTPEYIAPEIILNRGYDKGVDFWALGVFIYELLTGRTPFHSSDLSYMKTYKLILKGIDAAGFPQHVSEKACSILRKLCAVSPMQRLGCSKNGIAEIKRHEWFKGFDFDRLVEGTMATPFKPNLKNNIDTHYFDKHPKTYKVFSEDIVGWDEHF